MIRSYLRIACRNLLEYKAQNIPSITRLPIGFIAFLLGGYWYYWKHHFDSFHPQSKHTYALTITGIFKIADGSEGELNQIRQLAKEGTMTFPEIVKVYHVNDMKYETDGKERGWIGMAINSTFFSILQCRMVEGSYHKAPYNANFVILTRRMAKHLYGDDSCIGKEVRINKEIPYIAAKITENYPQDSDFKSKYLILNTP